VLIGVFLDLNRAKRAFERKDRVILLYHMQVEGIDDDELSWSRDYLTGRKQMAKFNISTSSELAGCCSRLLSGLIIIYILYEPYSWSSWRGQI
jgi:hypothetical protein